MIERWLTRSGGTRDAGGSDKLGDASGGPAAGRGVGGSIVPEREQAQISPVGQGRCGQAQHPYGESIRPRRVESELLVARLGEPSSDLGGSIGSRR